MQLLRAIVLTAVFSIIAAGSTLAAQPQVALGTAASFAVLAGETITNTGPTTITGDVGLHPGSAETGWSSVTLSGSNHVADDVALAAKNDLVAAYDDAAGRTPVTSVPTELGGTTLMPGVYSSDALALTGTLTLDAAGTSNAVFIFQTASTLITASNSTVNLINGASACNVFWQIGSSATLATSTQFVGTVMALTSIALQTGATLEGRALARNGAVTLDANEITTGTCGPGTGPLPSATGGNPVPSVPPTDTLAPSGTSAEDGLPRVLPLSLVFGVGLLLTPFLVSRTRTRHGGARRSGVDEGRT
ncbi:MAG: ice-binding family protein [Candidatus Limnocylindrales bacterium]